MDQSPSDSNAMRYVRVSEGEGNSINVSWTKMWDYYLLVFCSFVLYESDDSQYAIDHARDC